MNFYDKKMSKLWYEYCSVDKEICKISIKNSQYNQLVTKKLELQKNIMDYIGIVKLLITTIKEAY